MKKRILALMLTGAIALLAACGGQKYEAVPINEDVDKCEICNMQVKDDAFATQLTTKEGKTYKFDDLGCMNEWKRKNAATEIGMDYVRDYNDMEWIEFAKATYVYDASIRTPMAYGIVSFKDKADAEAFIAEHGAGKLMSAEDLASHGWERNANGMGMDHDHDHGSDEPHGGSEGGMEHGGSEESNDGHEANARAES
ncbi:nitrous oxide reductase accessory protein NosL [Paenibacillaceae bacterium WGS1546]|uniref:nitrous oxide reductase accessory protein NosL n=1 Tax=Cohnella sp. WGS1546 TaxID=3366810 RepID=UPI00372D87DC